MSRLVLSLSVLLVITSRFHCAAAYCNTKCIERPTDIPNFTFLYISNKHKYYSVGRDSSVGMVIFRTHLDRRPSNLLYNGYWVSFPGVKRPERGVNQQSTSSAEVKQRVELCLYSPPVPSWPVLGRNLPG
jgi:hypothetical protein